MEQMHANARSSMLDDRRSKNTSRSTLRFLVLLSLFTVTAPVIIMAATSAGMAVDLWAATRCEQQPQPTPKMGCGASAEEARIALAHDFYKV